MKRTSLILGLALVAACISLPAMASPITIDLGRVYTGAVPDGSGPWLEATLTTNVDSDPSTNDAKLTLTSELADGDFVAGLHSANSLVGWAFYVTNAVTDATCTETSTNNCPDSSLYSSTYNTGSVPGTFNLAFGWSDDSFVAGDVADVFLKFTDPLTGNPFGTDQTYYSVAHVQGITAPAGSGFNSCSGFIVNGTGGGVINPNDETAACSGGGTVTVPEPADLGMFGVGLLLLGLFVGLRRRVR